MLCMVTVDILAADCCGLRAAQELFEGRSSKAFNWKIGSKYTGLMAAASFFLKIHLYCLTRESGTGACATTAWFKMLDLVHINNIARM